EVKLGCVERGATLRLMTDKHKHTSSFERSKGEGQCQSHWKERSHSLPAARAALVLPSRSVWPRTERTWPSHTRKAPTRPHRWSKGLNVPAEGRSRFRRTPPMPTPPKPRWNRPSQPSANLMCL